MIDIKFLRENPEVVKKNIENKFQFDKLPLVDKVIELDEQRRKTQQEADNLKASRNAISKQIGALMAQGKKKKPKKLRNRLRKMQRSSKNLMLSRRNSRKRPPRL